MPTYIYQGGTRTTLHITDDTDLVPTQVSLTVPMEIQVTFAAPLTVDEQAALDQYMADNNFLPAAATARLPMLIPFVSGMDSTQITAPLGQGVGQKTFNPAAFEVLGAVRTIVFRVVLQATAGMTAEASLQNLDTGSTVTGTTLTTASTSPVEVVSAPLTVGADPDLPNLQQLYQVNLRLVGVPGPLDLVTIGSACLEIQYS